MILVSTMGFSGMPDLVMCPQKTLEIALGVKHPRWPPFGQGQVLHRHNFPHNKCRCMIHYRVFRYARPNGVVRNDITLW